MGRANRVLVTGGTGLLGNNVIRQLLAEGREVRALVRSSADPRPFQGLEGVELVAGDLRQSEPIERAVEGCDAVVHAAGFVHLGWGQADTHREVNTQGARQVALAARRHQARLVHVSTVNALGLGSWQRPACEQDSMPGIVACPYVTSKQGGEQAVRELIEDGLDGVVVNPGFLLGPWDWKPSSGRLLLELARKRFLIAPSGGFSVCDPRDVAAATIQALDRAPTGRQYILGGHNLSYFDGWKQFSETIGGAAPAWTATVPAQVVAGWLGDLWGQIRGREPLLNSASTGLGRQLHLFSSQRAMDELAYSYRPLADSVRDAWDWFLDFGYAPQPRRGRLVWPNEKPAWASSVQNAEASHQ